MNTNDINDTQLQQLLDSLGTHAKNQRRQAAILEEIDRLAAREESALKRRRRLWPYAATLAAAACIALLVMVRPADSPDIARVEPLPIQDKASAAASRKPHAPSANEAATRRNSKPQAMPLRTLTTPHSDLESELSDAPLLILPSNPETADSALPPSVITDAPATAAETEFLAEADFPTQEPLHIIVESNSLIAYGKGPARRSHRKSERCSEQHKDLFGNPIAPYGGALLAMEF